MPIYEYSCAPCGKTFEQLVLRASDEAEVRCPACGAADVARLVSRPAAARTGDGAAPRSRARGCGPVG